MDANQREEVIEKAYTDLIESLNRFGAKETLNLLAKFANDDLIVSELLVKFPSTVAVSEFFYDKPIYKIDEKTFKNLVESHPDIWIRKEKEGREEGRHIRKKAPSRLKKPESERGKKGVKENGSI